MTDAGPLGLVIAEEPVAGGWAAVGEVAVAAERAGASAVWITDHLFWHGSAADAPAALALVAQATSTCTLGPCVLQLPLRSVAATAKSMAFLDALAPGRVVVGVGIGEHRAEYEAAGRGDRYRSRGRLLDEGIDRLRAAWAHDGATGDGLAMAPARDLPIWVGGRSDRARHRAATVADGWIPHLCRADWFAAQQPLLDAELAAAGRPPGAVARAALVTAFVDEVEPDGDPLARLGALYGLDPRVFRNVLVRGSADQVASHLAAFTAAGADHLALLVPGQDPVAHLVAIEAARRA